MEKALLFAICVTAIFVVFKAIELKFIEKDVKGNMKYALRDTIMVFVSAIASGFVFLHYQGQLDEFLSVITNTKKLNPMRTQVFTGTPDF
jgi:hypothetical protein